ncbi:MAG: DUF4956 domain-containing protein [Anaerofustis sp.]
MLDSLFSTTTEDTFTLLNMVVALISALGLGFLISLAYLFIQKEEGYTPSFTITLIILPAVISVVIMLIGSNVARAFSLAGAFSLIRFRSAPGNPKDIAYILFVMGIGLACGMGYVLYAFVFAIIVSLVMFLLHITNYAKSTDVVMQLKITIPEDLNFQGLFDEVLKKYAKSWQLKRVRTTDFGTLFEVVYYIELKQSVSQKKLIDELRCRNGNLSIILTMREQEDSTALQM